MVSEKGVEAHTVEHSIRNRFEPGPGGACRVSAQVMSVGVGVSGRVPSIRSQQPVG